VNRWFGMTQEEKDAAKQEIREILVATARAENVITYQELTTRLTTGRLEPDSVALAQLLGEISAAEDAAGRGLLTVVVVRKGSGRPGRGFFAMAQQHGRDTADPERFLVAETQRVYCAWRSEPSAR
jgi:hypothetical protein